MNDTELQVWRTVQQLNRVWTSGRPGELSEYFHPSMRAMTPTDRHVLEGRDACVAAWAKFVSAVKVLRWNESSPRVQVMGSTAVVSYCYDLLGEAGGASLRLQGRDLFVLVLDGGRWWAVADAFSEFPASVTPSTPKAAPSWRLREAGQDAVEAVWRRRWGMPVVTLRGSYGPGDVEGLELTDAAGELAGLVTWSHRGTTAEVVTLDALRQREGIGSRLMSATEENLAARGVTRVILSTTNDNLPAIGFYLRRGYRVERVVLDAMEKARAVKPGIPPAGQSGIPIQDMWELAKPLGG